MKEAINYLLENGWKEDLPFSYLKGDYEIIFDTSTYYEIYSISSKERIREGAIQNLISLLNSDDLSDKTYKFTPFQPNGNG